MPRYGRKCFIVRSGFQETFPLKVVVTVKPELVQSTQFPCLSFPLQCNDLVLHEDRYFGNHSALVSSLAMLFLHRKHLQEIQLTYHKGWKLITNKHMLILNFMFLRQSPYLLETV